MATITARTGSRPATTVAADPEREATASRRLLLAGALTGALAGTGMYLVMAVTALAKGLGAAYPLWAVQGLMSGARVIPDHPRQSLVAPIPTDWVTGPLYFLLPAVLVGVLTAWVSSHGGRRAGAPTPVVALVVAASATAALFLLLVVELGFRDVALTAQRATSGYGIQALGMTAWAVAHVVYVALLVALLAPVHRLTALLRRRPTAAKGLRGE
jgi:hypothetical protein